MHIAALIAYLQGLRENNDKAWFVMNKPAYDILRGEFIALVTSVIAELARTDPRIAGVDAKKALFRIYRDIRFANDKTPYKTTFSAAVAEAGHKNSGPMYYLHIDADGMLHLAAGCYLPERDVLARIRLHVVRDARGFRRVVGNKEFVATFGALVDSDRLARLPKGFDVDAPGVAPMVETLKLKSYVVSHNVALLKKSNSRVMRRLPKTIARTLATATPLNTWLRAALAAEPAVHESAAAARSAPTRTKRAAKIPTS